MLKQIRPYAGKIVFSSFFIENQDMPHFAHDPHELEVLLKNEGFDKVQVTKNSKQGLQAALASKSNIIVVTGSLYILSEIYPLLNAATHNKDL